MANRQMINPFNGIPIVGISWAWGNQRNSVRRMTAGAAGTSNSTIGGGNNPGGGALVANDDDVSPIFAALLFIYF